MTAGAIGRSALRLDRVGATLAALGVGGLALGPFVSVRANRIVDGVPHGLFEALPPSLAAFVALVAAAAALVALFQAPPVLRAFAGAAALAGLTLALGQAPRHLTAPGDIYARVAPGWGYWLAGFASTLLVADALTRLRLRPTARIGALAFTCMAAAAAIGSGALDDLSIMKEYAIRAPSFWAEARTHLALALGSVAAALAIGAPLGVAIHRVSAARGPTLAVLTVVQTIPSIALFGLLIAPLAWLARTIPGAAEIGIAGVGAAPAFVALTLYALLPVVGSVVSGLGAAPPSAIDAARGAGMTDWQVLAQIEAPLGAPTFLSGVRVVTVQNIGLTTIAALVGGGGFGTFVFQGVGQTAIDLVLLGAVPTVALSFVAAVVLDAASESAGAHA
ncbi:MAG TPA: ABC transporter permease [Hansschlegelia sp.]